ncbi:hypothetical protein MJO28_011070 [Puccinia striiformis f. sp. tritici]|uniref:Uncharacterized protein n=3 Tax=Puccinia striiformis TaxID=27350 RepID=A0A0L0V6K7_9BASI|nr:hypothetical protein Pst134EA_020780 [Puccinia striiformis f. sp. tritici]KAH9456870.1 hypothetical protein Pst134EA_020780 [Puccinia striiformis f. sp. tritici]KAI7943542.1 hypothetical protein MJO28_011070 [Puccinia striiformis f. sp. tritici]KNE94619.1 hypothetical protein PSTG_11981 [Puccinia striiformis f. sp. tritici PST-78]
MSGAVINMPVLEDIVQEYGEAHLEIFIQSYLRRADGAIRAMEIFFQRRNLAGLAAQAGKLQRWAAALGLNRVYGLSTQILIQSGSNPMGHEEDQIGGKIKLLTRQNARAILALRQILANRRT